MTEQPRIQFPWKEHFPLREFFSAPKILLSNNEKLFVEEDQEHAVYIAEHVVGSVLDFDFAEELCLPLIDSYYLIDNNHFVGYYFKPKARNILICGTHIVVSTNTYKKSLQTDKKPKSDLQYTTPELSAFCSPSGSCMILRQFNSSQFIAKLES